MKIDKKFVGKTQRRRETTPHGMAMGSGTHLRGGESCAKCGISQGQIPASPACDRHKAWLEPAGAVYRQAPLSQGGIPIGLQGSGAGVLVREIGTDARLLRFWRMAAGEAYRMENNPARAGCARGRAFHLTG